MQETVNLEQGGAGGECREVDLWVAEGDALNFLAPLPLTSPHNRIRKTQQT